MRKREDGDGDSEELQEDGVRFLDDSLGLEGLGKLALSLDWELPRLKTSTSGS
jgi:hypothetical protein